MPSYTINEPHPTLFQHTFTHSGRGGAGNFFRAPVTTPATGIATSATVATAPLPPSNRWHSGRGGAGNIHGDAQKRPVMSFEEQYQLQSHIEEKLMGYVGRGGAGNVYTGGANSIIGSSRKASDASSRRSDGSSLRSGRSGLFDRLSNVFSRTTH